mmetsp:Transcript_121543/g.388871  ORF Transcript_121543/g.388871 Transcript_121543/m.388871 type:complete len:271 (-) Transcript_121543:2870-3682(-)
MADPPKIGGVDAPSSFVSGARFPDLANKLLNSETSTFPGELPGSIPACSLLPPPPPPPTRAAPTRVADDDDALALAAAAERRLASWLAGCDTPSVSASTRNTGTCIWGVDLGSPLALDGPGMDGPGRTAARRKSAKRFGLLVCAPTSPPPEEVPPKSCGRSRLRELPAPSVLCPSAADSQVLPFASGCEAASDASKGGPDSQVADGAAPCASADHASPARGACSGSSKSWRCAPRVKVVGLCEMWLSDESAERCMEKQWSASMPAKDCEQ